MLPNGCKIRYDRRGATLKIMIIDDIALTMLPGVGPRTAAHLLACFGSAGEIFASGTAELIGIAKLNPRITESVLKKVSHRDAEKELKYCERNGIVPLASTDALYPRLLRECNDYPHVVYYIGDTAALAMPRVLSVVGTRRMTSYGQNICARLVADLAAMFPDLVVASGLAFGIDATAHRAALTAGVRTVGVMAQQLPDIYPSAHTSLAAEMASRGGGVLTEFNSRNKEKGVNFIPRNRVIAGMGAGTLVVESHAKGGALMTAGYAHGYDRSVMAVPGRLYESASEGSNRLIHSQVAVMVRNAEDIATELGWEAPAKSGKPQREYDESILSGDARKVLALLPEGERCTIDDLAERSGLPLPELAPLLFELELENVIRMLPGKIYEKV